MSPERQQRLLRAARRMPPVPAPETFCGDVLRTIRRQEGAAGAAGGVFETLNVWFPRLAVAAIIIILGMGVFDYCLDGDVVGQLTAASEEWTLAEEWL